MPKRAFTYIEILFLCSILIFIGVAVPSALRRETMRQDDQQRMENLQKMHAAAEEYKNVNGHYPITNGEWTSFDSSAYSPNSIYTPNAANLTKALSPYMDPIQDISSPDNDGGYLYLSYTGSDFCVMAWRTPEDMNDFAPDVIPSRCGGISGGQCKSGANAIYIGTGQFSSGC